MDKIKFAQMVADISRKHSISFTYEELSEMLATIMAGTVQPEVKYEPATHDQIVAAAGREVTTLMWAMRDNKFIDAIKACRMLTGLGLKEAKDMVEAARANFKP